MMNDNNTNNEDNSAVTPSGMNQLLLVFLLINLQLNQQCFSSLQREITASCTAKLWEMENCQFFLLVPYHL